MSHLENNTCIVQKETQLYLSSGELHFLLKMLQNKTILESFPESLVFYPIAEATLTRMFSLEQKNKERRLTGILLNI